MDRKSRIIIDTDPGVDDVLALLLALSSSEDELEILLISVTFGNVEVLNCLRNVISLFHTVAKELEWRKKTGRPQRFESLKKFRPRVAIGADEPLADQLMMADYFHGIDGLGGIHSSHPHLTPAETWRDLFTTTLSSGSPEEKEAAREMQHTDTMFTPVQTPAHEEILRLLRDNDADTITIIAIGPLTNLARAAATDPEIFLRAKEIVVMGGAISTPGNITPVAEFNIYADAIAAARVLALTSPIPSSNLPPAPPPPPPSTQQSPAPPPPFLAPYPEPLSRTLHLALLPLDLTTAHLLRRGAFAAKVSALVEAGSPLAEWVAAFMASTFRKVEALEERKLAPGADVEGEDGDGEVGLSLHDPLCVWYVLSRGWEERSGWKGEVQDVRVETSGQWTRGMCVVDRRDRKKRDGDEEEEGMEIKGDHGGWLSRKRGNRVRRMVESGWDETFAGVMLERIFGVS